MKVWPSNKPMGLAYIDVESNDRGVNLTFSNDRRVMAQKTVPMSELGQTIYRAIREDKPSAHEISMISELVKPRM